MMKYLLSLLLILESSLLMGKITITQTGEAGGKELANYLTTSADEVLSVDLQADIIVKAPIELEHKKEIIVKGMSTPTPHVITAFQGLLVFENIEKITFDTVEIDGAGNNLLVGKHINELIFKTITTKDAPVGLFADVGLLHVSGATFQSSSPCFQVAALETGLFYDVTVQGSGLCHLYKWNSPIFDQLMGGDEIKFSVQQQPSLVFDTITLTGISSTDDPMLCNFYINSWNVESLHEDMARASGTDPYSLDYARGGAGPMTIDPTTRNWGGLPKIFAQNITKTLAGSSSASTNTYLNVLDSYSSSLRWGLQVRLFGNASIKTCVTMGSSTAPVAEVGAMLGNSSPEFAIGWMGMYDTIGFKELGPVLFVRSSEKLQDQIDAVLSDSNFENGITIYLAPGKYSLDKPVNTRHVNIQSLSRISPATLEINVGKTGAPETTPPFSTGCLEMHDLLVMDNGKDNNDYPLAKTFILDMHNVNLNTMRPNVFVYATATATGILNKTAAPIEVHWPIPKNLPYAAQPGLGWAGLLQCSIQQTSDQETQVLFKNFPELYLFQSMTKQNTNIKNDSSFYLGTDGLSYIGLAHSRVYCSTFCKLDMHTTPENPMDFSIPTTSTGYGVVLDFHRGENSVGVLQTFLHLTNDWSQNAPHIRYLKGLNNQVHIQQSKTGHGFVWVNTKSALPPHVQGDLHSMMYYQVPTIFHPMGSE